MVTQFICLFIVSFMLMFLLVKLFYPLAIKWNFIDLSYGHKQHNGEIPIIGGISFYVNILILLLSTGKISTEYLFLLIETGILAITGIIDDKYSISIKFRLFAEIIAAMIMIFFAKVMVTDLGDLLSIGNIILTFIPASVFTIIAVVGIINCINMIDGLDGLAAMLIICSLIGCLITINNLDKVLTIIIISCGSLTSFLLFNLRVNKTFYCVFLGDCGSMVLGFILCWVFIVATQSSKSNLVCFKPVTALFLLGLPLIDMVSTILKRIKNKKNPLKADRCHIHHIILQSGFSKKNTLLILVAIQCLFVLTGVIMHIMRFSSYLQFYSYILFFAYYYNETSKNFITTKKVFLYYTFLKKNIIKLFKHKKTIKILNTVYIANEFSNRYFVKIKNKKTNNKKTLSAKQKTKDVV